mmetsp:Transcript_98471/g.306351  ORF Transcript_98471/g.306351 Transcript_98471/m.306351 type:complete len:159 (-) Transcript_98471:66-542(-)
MMGMPNMSGMGGMGMMGNMGGMGGMCGGGGMGGAEDATVTICMAGKQGGGGGGSSSYGGKDNFTLGKELVTQVMDDMPSYVTQDPRGFVLRSAVPSRMVGALQKRALQVMNSTGTKVSFHGEATATARMMSIEGPLLNVCASYMLMMRRYLEVEREIS